MADRVDRVALRSGNIIRIRDRGAEIGARSCRFLSYALQQPRKIEAPKARRRRKAGAAA